MLLAVQVPVVDVRRLLSMATGRHPQPDFPKPDRVHARHTVDHHRTSFVAGLGPVRPRLRGRGSSPWPSESYYVDARASVRLGRQVSTIWGRRQGARPVYRNFYTDGVVGRLELGFQSRLRPGHRSESVLPELCNALLASPVRLAAPVSPATAGVVPLVNFGSRFAGHLLAATTNRAEGVCPEPWWITAGTPALIVEVTRDEEPVVLSPDFAYQRFGAVEQRWQRVSGVRVSMWTLRQGDSTLDEFRRLRVHVSRLHSDFAAFDAVLAMCEAGKLDPEQPAVEAYLIRTIELLIRPKRHGFAQLELLTYVVNAAQGAYPDTVAALDYLGGQLGSGRLRDLLEALRLVLDDATRVVFQIGDISVNNFETHIDHVQGPVHTGSGDQHVRDVNIGAGPDVAALLADLTKAIEGLRETLPPDTAITVEDTAEGVRRELERPEGERDKQRLGDRVRRLLGIANEAGAAGTSLAGAVTAIGAAVGL
ncbi:MAG: hypothetical protein ACRDT4_09200 [Micromonosporaceae bacterium]